jgi:elongation factor Ts
VAPVKDISAKLVAELRGRTGAGMMDCKRALEETGGDLDKAVELLRSKSIAKADKRAAHHATEGLIDAYVHFNGKVAVLIELNCETDFVARTDAFRQLVRDLALHVASQAPLAVKIEDLPPAVVDSERRIYEAQVIEQKKPEGIRPKIVEGMLRKFYEERVLYEQKFVKDDSRTVGEMVRGLAAQTGENIQVRRFARFELGGE